MTSKAEEYVGSENAEILREIGPELVIKLADLSQAPDSYKPLSIARALRTQREALAANGLINSASGCRPLPKFGPIADAAHALVEHAGRTTNMIELFLEEE